MWPAAAMTTGRRVGCWNCRFGCSTGRLARQCGLRRSLGWISPRFRRCGYCSMRRRSGASRLGSHHRMLVFREQQGSLTTRIGERSMRRQRHLRRDRRSGTQQFDLFATGGGGGEVGVIGGAAVKARIRPATIVQRDHRTPIGPRNVRSFIFGIHGQDASFIFMR